MYLDVIIIFYIIILRIECIYKNLIAFFNCIPVIVWSSRVRFLCGKLSITAYFHSSHCKNWSKGGKIYRQYSVLIGVVSCSPKLKRQFGFQWFSHWSWLQLYWKLYSCFLMMQSWEISCSPNTRIILDEAADTANSRIYHKQ